VLDNLFILCLEEIVTIYRVKVVDKCTTLEAVL
jgi:hypothetical protein